MFCVPITAGAVALANGLAKLSCGVVVEEVTCCVSANVGHIHAIRSLLIGWQRPQIERMRPSSTD